MSYVLKQFDINLLYFDMQKDIDGVAAWILSVSDRLFFLLKLEESPMELTSQYKN